MLDKAIYWVVDLPHNMFGDTLNKDLTSMFYVRTNLGLRIYVRSYETIRNPN